MTRVLRRSLGVGALKLFQTNDANPSPMPAYAYTEYSSSVRRSPIQFATRMAVRKLPVTSAMAAKGSEIAIAVKRNTHFSQGSFRSIGEGEGKVAKKT